MPHPSSYTRKFDFEPLRPPNVPEVGARANAEFDDLARVLAQFRVNLALIQRDDGKLANQSVHPDALSAMTRVLTAGAWTPRGAWVTATAYAPRDAARFADVTYVAVTAHTGGVFATDLAAGRWMAITVVGAEDLQAAIDAVNAALVGIEDVIEAADQVDVAIEEVESLLARASAAVTLAERAAETVGQVTVAYVEALSPVPTTTPDAYLVGAGPFDMGDVLPGTAPFANERASAISMDLSRGLGGTIDFGSIV
jgi:hypothetical protein